MLKSDALSLAGFLMTSASIAIQHSVQVAANMTGAPTIQPEECFFAALGGLIGGIGVISHMPKGRTAKGFTLLTCCLFAFGLGPLLANWAANSLAYVGNGQVENIVAGVMVGAFGVPIYRLVSSILLAAGNNPGSVTQFLTAMISAWKKR